MNKDRQNIQVGMLPDYWRENIKIPDVQREDTAWSLEQQQMLIDSLYNNYDIPKFYLRLDDSLETWWLLDGQQRLTAITKFLNDEFPLGDFTSLPENIRNKIFSELPAGEKAKIKLRSLDFILLTCTEDEEEDLFLRLNKGTPLNAAEKRHAIRGEARDLAIELSKHKFFNEKINFPTNRYAGHAVCAQLILLADRREPTDVKGHQLRKFYEDNKRFPETAIVKRQIKKALNRLNKAFKGKEVYMKKYNVISLFCFVDELDQNYTFSSIKDIQLYEFIDDFEKQRRLNNKRSEDDGDFKKDLFLYAMACVNSPDSKESVATRHDVLLRRFLDNYPNLELKDTTRGFTKEQKETIYLLCNKRCQGVKKFACPQSGLNLPYEDCEFDHKLEYSRGGKTSVDNGQVLCHSCHAEKTASLRR